jgi:multidrug efflux pump subunit AcrB
MKKEFLYLKKLKFDKQLQNTFIARYLSNPRLLFLLIVAIISIGLSSYFNLPRRLNPEIKIPIIIVTTILPGASPQDIESLITKNLESSINRLDDVKKITSSSRDNISIISVEFDSGVDPDKAKQSVQSAIESVNLPTDAQKPVVQKIDFENQPVWSFTITGSDLLSIKKFADILKKELENLPSIEKITTGGLEEKEIVISINPEKIATYGINPLQISQLVKSSVNSFPAGSVHTSESSFTLTIDPLINSLDDVRKLNIFINGSVFALSEIAEVYERSKPNQFLSYFATPTKQAQPSITFSVYKTPNANINEAVADSEKIVKKITDRYDGRFTIQTITNTGNLIDKQFNHLLRDFIITVLLVFFVLFIFLGARQAFVSFFAVPLTFLISFSVMKISGISLNFLSLFSLLLSLGLLVDDTIVVISAMTQYYRTGKFTPLQTGLLVWRDFGVPILTTTLTTVWAFVPLLLSTGIIGEFIKSIPIVVSSTLLASLGVAMLIILPLMIILLKPQVPQRVIIAFRILLVIILISIYIWIAPKGIGLIIALIGLGGFLFVTSQIRLALIKGTKKYIIQQSRKKSFLRKLPAYFEKGFISFSIIERKYRLIITRILAAKQNRRNAIIMVIIFSIFSYLLLPLGFVKNEFFPKSDQNFLYINLELPPGTDLTQTTQEAINILNKLRSTQEISYITADVGKIFSREFTAVGNNENTVMFSIVLPDRKERSHTSMEIADFLRQSLSSYTKGKITVSEVSGGPPAGSDIQIKLFGDDIGLLDNYAEKVKKFLENQGGVTDIQKSIKAGPSQIVFVPHQNQLANFNISQDILGIWLRTFASGLKLESLRQTNSSEEEIDITLQFGKRPQDVANISSLTFPSQFGPVPITQLGSFILKPSPTLITREDGKRTISISASVKKGFSVTDINKKLEQFAKNDLKLEEGYFWKTGGVNEENQKSVYSILQAMILSFLLIIVTMVIQFTSFRKAIIVILVIPLSISGVFVIFGLTQTPLSFPALIGVLALFGIVVKNSILIVDKITTNQKSGMSFQDSIVDAAGSRLEPIALTSLATIMGLIPITISDPLWRGLGGAIIAGLTFSGTIMLFFIPVVYFMWFNPKDQIQRPKRQREK